MKQWKRGALFARIEHEEEPPMEEGEEFVTVMEYWVMRSPTKLLSLELPEPPTLPKPSDPSEIGCLHPLNQRPPQEPLDPEAVKTVMVEVWVEMVAAAPTHSSGYVNVA